MKYDSTKYKIHEIFQENKFHEVLKHMIYNIDLCLESYFLIQWFVFPRNMAIHPVIFTFSTTYSTIIKQTI